VLNQSRTIGNVVSSRCAIRARQKCWQCTTGSIVAPARIVEVDIGHIEHESQSLTALAEPLGQLALGKRLEVYV